MNGKQNLLITGATGYIGSSLVDKLLENSLNNIAVVARDLKEAKNMFQDKVTYISTDERTFKSAINDFCPEIVVHLASYSSSSDSTYEIKKLIESNILFTSLLLDALSESKVKFFINTGSFSEYYYNNEVLSPTYFYSATKSSAGHIIDYYSKKYNFKLINAILYTVYGKKSKSKKIIDYSIESLNAPNPVKMSDGKQILDFIHLDDVIDFYTNVIYKFDNLNICKKNYFVGTGYATSIKELVKIIECKSKKKANIAWGANKSREIDTKQAVANIAKTSEDLLWSADISINEGIEKYLYEVIQVEF